VYPSYFEGFGLPILEAMQCGAPVIAGNRTSVPELVGDAGVLFDPFNTHALVDALKRTLDDAEFRANLREAGIERARAFSWKTTAQLTLRAYETAVELFADKHKVNH
jgi:glycosyltransferase involved in cell wall biosynthesis